MPSRSRRQVLGGFAVLLVGGSGCTRTASRDTPTDTATASERTFSHCIRDPTTHQVRHPEGEPAIRSAAFTPTGDWRSAEWVVTSPRERDALVYSTGATGVGEAQTFVEDTELSAQTLLVHQHGFENCLTLQVARLKWNESEYPPEGAFDVGVEYTTERDEDCRRDDTRGTIATLARIPADIAEIGRFTWGTAEIGQNSC